MLIFLILSFTLLNKSVKAMYNWRRHTMQCNYTRIDSETRGCVWYTVKYPASAPTRAGDPLLSLGAFKYMASSSLPPFSLFHSCFDLPNESKWKQWMHSYSIKHFNFQQSHVHCEQYSSEQLWEWQSSSVSWQSCCTLLTTTNEAFLTTLPPPSRIHPPYGEFFHHRQGTCSGFYGSDTWGRRDSTVSITQWTELW